LDELFHLEWLGDDAAEMVQSLLCGRFGKGGRLEWATRDAWRLSHHQFKWCWELPRVLREKPHHDCFGCALTARINSAVLWALDEELTPATPAGGADLSVLAASPGVITAPVRIIRSAAEIEKLRAGEVLMCQITTPAWTVVFRRAAALVTDGGSLLSHAAIVAREHGIPAVVGTGDATRRLRDGELVTVDGNRGVITRAGR